MLFRSGLNAILTELRGDLAARKDTRGDKFKVTIHGKEYKDRQQANALIIKEAFGLEKPDAGQLNTKKLGQFAGYELSVWRSDVMQGWLLSRGADSSYKSELNKESDAIRSMELRLQGIERRIENFTNSIKDKEKELADLQAEAKKPWGDQEKLNELLVRQQEIDKQLGIGMAEEDVVPEGEGEEYYIYEQGQQAELDAYRVDIIRKLPEDINLPNRREFTIELFDAAQRLMSPARYSKIRRRLEAGSFKPGEIKVDSVENTAVMAHELGHSLDYALSGNQFPSTVSKRFPEYVKDKKNSPRLEVTFRKELKEASNFMRPVEGGPAAFGAYRNKPTELMADFYSLYFMDPARAKTIAPTVVEAFELQVEEMPELAELVEGLHGTRAQVAAGQAEVEKIRPEDDPTSLITPEEMETLPFPEIVKRMVVMRGRHHRMQVILASKRSDRWKNMVSEEQLEDIGAAVEGIGNLRTGSTYEQIMATMTPAMKQVMKEYQFHQEKLRELVNKYMAEVGPQEYITYLENYLPHFYVKPPRLRGGSSQGIARWSKHSPNAKARKFPTLQEAVDAGLIPITQNVAKLHVRWANINFRVATNRQFIEVLAKLPDETGMPVIRKPADAPADWKKVDHPAIRKVYARKAKDGTLILWEGGAAVHPEIYQATRQIFEMPFDGPTAKTIEMFNAIAKKIQLSFSFFHHWALSESGLASLTNIMRGKPLRAIIIVGDDEQTLGSGIRIPMTKLKVTMPHAVGLRLLKLEDFVRDATLSGMTSEALPDAQIGVVQKALESAEAYTRKIFGVGTAVRAVKKANEWWDRQLWDHLHAGLKAYTYYSLVGDVLAKAPDNVSNAELKKIKEKIGAAVNDMFGGQEWEAAFWLSPRARQVSQMLLLAPDWTYSNIKVATRLFTDARDPVMGPISRKYWYNMLMFFLQIGRAHV